MIIFQSGICPTKWQPTLGLCAGVALEFSSARNRRLAFYKDKYLEPMFGDASQARINAAMLLLMIATISSHTCTKPTVMRSAFILVYLDLSVF